MAVLGEGERPRGELEPVRQTHLVQPDQQAVEDQRHAGVVEALRQAIRLKQQEKGGYLEGESPARIIQYEIMNEAIKRWYHLDPQDDQRGKFVATMLAAWDAIAYEHYPKNSIAKTTAYHELRDRAATGRTVIPLSKPQMQLLDALAEAADIPHQRGQTEIAIPALNAEWWE